MALSEEDLKQIMDAVAGQSQGVEDLETVSCKLQVLLSTP